MTVKDLECHVCKSTFQFTHLRGILPKYCSEECKTEWRKDQAREKSKKYRERNPKKVADTQKRYRESNLEKLKEYDKQRYLKNRNYFKEKGAKWYSNNKEKAIEYSRAYYRENSESYAKYREATRSRYAEYRRQNKDLIAKANKKYYLENREACRASSYLYYARKKSALIGEKVEASVLIQKYSGKCGICGGAIFTGSDKRSPLSLHVDHIVPLSKGGEHSYANTQPAHASCNVQKGDKLDGWQNIKPILNQEEQAWLDQPQGMTMQNMSATTSELSGNGASM